MAAHNHILSLDLGTQTVSFAEFRTGPNGGLILAKYRNTELMADPAADATRQAQARIAVGELTNALGVKGQKVNYAIASQAVFTRFVKLPSVGEEQVDQIVKFEAQQNVPYPIDEVVWDYQLVESGDSAQVEVVIVAIKSDLLDEINDGIDAAHLKTSVVDVAPMALYNAFRYNYSDVTGCALIIDIGARSTNLVFVEPRKVFSRSIPTGGNTVTAAIAKDFNEPFGAAEERKKRDGFVSLGGAYADPDDADIARVSKMIRNTMTRLHAEISRSIAFYRTQQGGSQPTRVYLAGGTASLPYMREFFHEKFQLPVEFFNPLRNVSVGGDLDLESIGRHAHSMGPLVGLALRGFSACPMELNLRPAKVVRRHRLTEQRPALILAGVCVLLALAGWWFYYFRATAITNQVLEKIDPKVTELQGFESKMKAVKADIKAQEDEASPILQAIDDRDYWATILKDINSRLPEDFVWITSFEPQTATAANVPGKKPALGGASEVIVQLKGLWLANARNTAVVDDFIDQLDKSPYYNIDRDKRTRAEPNESTWAYDWSVPLILKNPINIPPTKK